MGLNCSHGCWDGPYSSFSRFRESIANMLGFQLKSMQGFGGNLFWEGVCSKGWEALLHHSDCDGYIYPHESEALLFEMERYLNKYRAYVKENHTSLDADYLISKYETFMDGVRAALECNEDIRFE